MWQALYYLVVGGQCGKKHIYSKSDRHGVPYTMQTACLECLHMEHGRDKMTDVFKKEKEVTH